MGKPDTIKKKLILKCILITLFSCMVSHGYAQLIRNFPLESKLGKLKSHDFPELKIDGETMYMGAGGQIRDINNRLVLPNMLNQTGYIRYQMDNMGFVHRVWFLSNEEFQLAKEEDKASKKQNR